MSVSGKDVGREGNDTCKQAAQYVMGKRKPRTKTQDVQPHVLSDTLTSCFPFKTVL